MTETPKKPRLPMPGEPTDFPRLPPLPVSPPTPRVRAVVPNLAEVRRQMQARAFVRVYLDQGFRARLPRPTGLADVRAKAWTYLPNAPIDAPFGEVGRFYGYGYRISLGFDERVTRGERVDLRFVAECGPDGLPFRNVHAITLVTQDHRVIQMNTISGSRLAKYATAAWHPLSEHEAVVEFILGHMTHAVSHPSIFHGLLSAILGRPRRP